MRTWILRTSNLILLKWMTSLLVYCAPNSEQGIHGERALKMFGIPMNLPTTTNEKVDEDSREFSRHIRDIIREPKVSSFLFSIWFNRCHFYLF